MKKLILLFFIGVSISFFAQVANDNCQGAIDYGVLDGSLNTIGNDGAMYDTCFDVSNLNAVPNFPFYYSNQFCTLTGTNTNWNYNANGVHNDVWYKLTLPSEYFQLLCMDFTFSLDSARITFWRGDGNCGNFFSSSTQLIPFVNGNYYNSYYVPQWAGGNALYFQISGKEPSDIVEFRMCLRGSSLIESPICSMGFDASSSDSLCFINTLSTVNPSTTDSNDGTISTLTSMGTPPYSYLWNTGDTTSNIGNVGIGNYSVTITDSTGCSNTHCIQLTSNTLHVSTCGGYTLNGETYTQSGIYTQTLQNAVGCDSIITLNLTITTINNETTLDGNTITANQAGVSYQWIDCADNTPISDADFQTFTATQNGSFAVVLSDGTCLDTSVCTTFSTIGLIENDLLNFSIFPNPAQNELNILISGTEKETELVFYAITGEEIVKLNAINSNQAFKLDITEWNGGIYYCKVKFGNDYKVKRFTVLK